MPIDCQQGTSGGKGNMGMFYERTPNICSAGIPSQQPNNTVADALKQYHMQDEVDALISDAIVPLPKHEVRPTPKGRPDKRNAGIFNEVGELISPPMPTKFQALVNDLKETTYASYWEKPLGKGKNQTPMLPAGFDLPNTTFGKVLPHEGHFYDAVLLPKIPIPGQTPISKLPGIQTNRKYCQPQFSKDYTYGRRSYKDNRGILMKCCLTDNSVMDGTSNRAVINSIQADYLDRSQTGLGIVLNPIENAKYLPKGFTYGQQAAYGLSKPPDNLVECLSFCKINPQVDFMRKCVCHLNTVKKCLSKRFDVSLFRELYLKFKYLDKENTGCLPKETVYDYCNFKLIRFDPHLLEPLLKIWNGFDGQRIDYKIFCDVINFKEPSPTLPKIKDIPADCLDFTTTYKEMVKCGQEVDDRPMAGVPSGRYFDRDYPVTPANYCQADNTNLPQETNVKACINPSVMTNLSVSHRDMYGKREPYIVRRVFEAAGETFTDESFAELWKEAQTLHSQGWVCYETFRQILKRHVRHHVPEPMETFIGC